MCSRCPPERNRTRQTYIRYPCHHGVPRYGSLSRSQPMPCISGSRRKHRADGKRIPTPDRQWTVYVREDPKRWTLGSSGRPCSFSFTVFAEFLGRGDSGGIRNAHNRHMIKAGAQVHNRDVRRIHRMSGTPFEISEIRGRELHSARLTIDPFMNRVLRDLAVSRSMVTNIQTS